MPFSLRTSSRGRALPKGLLFSFFVVVEAAAAFASSAGEERGFSLSLAQKKGRRADGRNQHTMAQVRKQQNRESLLGPFALWWPGAAAENGVFIRHDAALPVHKGSEGGSKGGEKPCASYAAAQNAGRRNAFILYTLSVH
jgi:hypothetical protein